MIYRLPRVSLVKQRSVLDLRNLADLLQDARIENGNALRNLLVFELHLIVSLIQLDRHCIVACADQVLLDLLVRTHNGR